MLRKQQVEERLDQLQLSIDRLKSGVVTADGSSIAVDAFLQYLKQVETQLEAVVNLIDLED
jgi:hypothetical protein